MNEEVKYNEIEEDLEKKDLKENNVSKNVIEFFLGKNVIAKIAGILIFLGIVSFGQLAFERMPDLGRISLVFALAMVFVVLGWWLERKKSEVFSNVFYILSVVTFYLVIVLSRYQYDLIENSYFTYSSIALMVASFLYFHKRRYNFLDSVLLVFYMIVGFIPHPYLEWKNTFSNFTEVTLLMITLGFIIYVYFTKYLNNKLALKTMMVNTISVIIIIELFIMQFDIHDGFKYYEIMYSLFVILFIYIVNIKGMQKSTINYKFFIPFFTTILIVFIGANIGEFMYDYFDFRYASYIPLYIVVLLLPIYIYNFIKNDEDMKGVNLYYLGVIALSLYLFATTAGAQNFIGEPYEFYILNIIGGSIFVIFFLLSKITKDLSHKVISYFFIVLLMFNNIGYYFEREKINFNNLDVVLPSFLFGLSLILINLYFRYIKKEEDENDYFVVQSTNLILMIPVIIMLSREIINNDIAVVGAIVVVGLIGYRWLMELNIFKMKYKHEFLFMLNIKIVALVLVINLFYFDHNFSLINDVMKFLLVFCINVYIVQSLIEIYNSKWNKADKERVFILIYLIGATVHSYFIHNYINIEFDKVILSSYFMIASAVGILIGFKGNWTLTRKIGLATIYYSLAKFFIYDFYTQDFSTFVRMVTYFILGFVLLGISALYAYLEKEYKNDN